MKIISLLVIFVVTISPALAEHHGDSDESAITAVVFDYFHGLGEASTERLNRAFAPNHATMVGVLKKDTGEEYIRSWKDMNEVLANWASNDTPPGSTQDGELLNLHITDGRIATVIFRFTDEYYDALTLAKVNGEWKIVAKAFIFQ